LHPSHLDAKGLVALWRETLLAKHVLNNKTRGYKNHPQLCRFKETRNPVACINRYLAAVFEEAQRRNYQFDKTKIASTAGAEIIKVTDLQLDYEFSHLKKKLWQRDRKKYDELGAFENLRYHPSFKIIQGPVAAWEKAPA